MILDYRDKNFTEILLDFKTQDLSDLDSIKIKVDGKIIEEYGYKSWVDFAQINYLKMLTPVKENDGIILDFKILNQNSSFHNSNKNDEEKYGVDSEFFNVDKTTQVSFLHYYQDSLKFVDIDSKKRILDLGINKADEFKVIKDMLDQKNFDEKEFIGIDYSNSAIEFAKEHFKYKNVNFLCEDINKLDSLKIGKFDLIVSIGTLQSRNINFKTTLSYLVQNMLSENGSIIFGFPNSRWIDGENIYGAVAPNYNFSEMSLVIKDIYYAKKYLQQKKFRVTITGKDYLFLTARKIGLNKVNDE